MCVMVWHWMRLILILNFLILNFTHAEDLRFKKARIKIRNTSIKVEVAKSNAQLKHGLMHRTQMDKNSGMLFVYESELYLSFWMKNTYIPLSIAFINKDKVIVDIQDMLPAAGPVVDSQLRRYKSKRPSQYALEMNKGWFKTHKIAVGDKIKFLEPLP